MPKTTLAPELPPSELAVEVADRNAVGTSFACDITHRRFEMGNKKRPDTQSERGSCGAKPDILTCLLKEKGLLHSTS